MPLGMTMTETTRLRGDSRPVVLTATVLVGVLALAAFVMGVPGLLIVAEWAGLEGWLRYPVPVVLDAGLVISALAAVVARARYEQARLPRPTLASLTAPSVAAPVAHVAVPADGVSPEVVGGAVISMMAPLVVLLATEMLLSLAIAPPVKRSARKVVSVPAPAKPVTTPAAERPALAPAPAPTPSSRVGGELTGDQVEMAQRYATLRGEGLGQARAAAEAGFASKGTAERWLSKLDQAA